MIEKVNPAHPDKIADRIAGAIVDLAYRAKENPRIAVEVLVGHGRCHIIIETDVALSRREIKRVVRRIADKVKCDIKIVAQDVHLAKNQSETLRCGDNGIFKGVPITEEQRDLSEIARLIYVRYPRDGKYILDTDKLIICQSGMCVNELRDLYPNAIINPLGNWSGGINVDSGATNRKLGSDMADALTGGGLHGKDLSKADVSLNIYAHLKAQKTGKPVCLSCAIGDDLVDGLPYTEIVRQAKDYVESLGGFEKLAEWGLF